VTGQHLCAGLTLLAALACGSETNTGPTPPAEPTGKLLLFDPTGPVHVLDLSSGETREVSRFGEPFTWVAATLGKDASTVVGGGSGVGPPDPGIRQLDLVSGIVTTLVDNIVVAATRVSPDGRTLIFGAAGWANPRAVIATLDLVGTAEPVVVWTAPDDHQEWGLAGLRWLPDQTGLIAQLYDIDVVQIVHYDLASGVITPITEPTTTLEMTRTLDLSPDGQTIAYNTHTGELRFITRTGAPAPGYPTDLRGLLPAFSPDGEIIAFRRHVGEPGNSQGDGVWFYRFSDGELWRALPEDSPLTWVLDWG
jgi:hypothetical protein